MNEELIDGFFVSDRCGSKRLSEKKTKKITEMKYKVGQKLICVEDYIMDSEYEDTIEIKKNPEYGKNIAFKKGNVYVIKDIIEYSYYKYILHSEFSDEHQLSIDSINYYFRDSREIKLKRILNNK